MKANSTTLDPSEGVHIIFVEILARRRNIHPTNARRILNEMGLKPIRLSGKTLRYRLDELIAAEEATRTKLQWWRSDKRDLRPDSYAHQKRLTRELSDARTKPFLTELTPPVRRQTKQKRDREALRRLKREARERRRRTRSILDSATMRHISSGARVQQLVNSGSDCEKTEQAGAARYLSAERSFSFPA